MNVLVLGGTGRVGTLVTQELIARNVNVRVLTRSANKARNLPAGAEVVIGDLLDPQSMRAAFRYVDGVFLLNAVGLTETHEGLTAVNGARMAGVERVVYLSVHNLEQGLHVPHFGSKLPIETVIKSSNLQHTILRPNHFYQNDHWSQEALLQHGVYPQPIGDVGLSRVDVRDIAEAAAIALTTSGHAGETYNLVGPEAHTGQSSADIWSRALDRSITYVGNDLDAWEQQSLKSMPAWLVFDLKLMYAFFQANGLKATPADIERQTKLLGHPPRNLEDFAQETASQWGVKRRVSR